jgi:hypothetical protein
MMPNWTQFPAIYGIINLVMSIVIKNQIEASERSAEELEHELKTNHQQALVCREVESLMESLIAIAVELGKVVEHWQTGASQEKLPDEFGIEIFDLYVRLEKTATRTALMARAVEKWGYTLSQKKRFSTAWRELKGIVCFSPDRVAKSFAQIQNGETQTLGEVANELSRDFDR